MFSTNVHSIFLIFTLICSVVFNFVECEENVLDNFTWECANNSSCVNSVANNLIRLYKEKKSINFELFSVQENIHSDGNGRSQLNDNEDFGAARGFSDILHFLEGNSIRIPLGPTVFQIQRSDEDSEYIEVALLKKYAEGRARRGGGMKQKKQMQMMIPMYLAANAFGWSMVALKTVGILALKALMVSKLAIIVAVVVVIRKLMENAQEKMLYAHFPPPHHEHSSPGAVHPFVMPYSMEYAAAMPPHTFPTSDFSHNDLYSLHVPAGHAGLEQITAESSLNHVVDTSQQNVTQQHLMSPLPNGASVIGNNIKREDMHLQWPGTEARPVVYRYVAPSNTQVYNGYGKV